MKTYLIAGFACVAAVALSGCALPGGGPSNLAPVIDALARAGCTGDLTFSGGATTAAGLSPGGGHVENAFHGACDPRNASAVAAPAPPAAASPSK